MVHDVKYATFLLVLHYLYTDEVQIQVDNAMDLFQVRDCPGVPCCTINIMLCHRERDPLCGAACVSAKH